MKNVQVSTKVSLRQNYWVDILKETPIFKETYEMALNRELDNNNIKARKREDYIEELKLKGLQLHTYIEWKFIEWRFGKDIEFEISINTIPYAKEEIEDENE